MIEFTKLGAIPYVRTGAELIAPIGSGLASAAPTPLTYNDPKFFSTPILMQGKSPECGGFSLAFVLEYLNSVSTPLSGSFSYAYEKTVDGVPNSDGTTIKALGDAAQSAGSCLLNLFTDDGNTTANPQGNSTLYSTATAQAIADALTRAGWLPMFLNDLSWSGLQSAISKYGVVILEAEVGAQWWTSQYGKTIPVGQTSWSANDLFPLVPPSPVVDSHFFVLGGTYNPTEIYFANSWSTEWGQGGFGWLGQNYLPFIQNAIVFYKIPPVVQPKVNTVVSDTTLTPTQKNSIIQAIINDIEQEITLIGEELNLTKGR